MCGARNLEDEEFCRRCHQKLLVVSGAAILDEEGDEEDAAEAFSFDEHLLERISVLEEAVRRTADTVRQLVGAVHKQEQALLVGQTGLAALRELLEHKGTLAHSEWSELWESKMDSQLLALEKRERFLGVRERVAALYRGDGGERFRERLSEAEEAFGALDVERAMTALEEAFALDRANYELAFFLAEARYAEGDSDAALGYFARVLEVRPDHFEALVYGGVLLHEAGDSERAEELLKRAVANHPDEFLPAFSLGAIYAAGGNLSRAAAFLERAVEIDPLPQALYLLGNCYYEMGRATPAIRRLEAAVHADPAFEEAWHVLGLAYLERHWNRKALEAFRQAQRLNPKKLQYQDLVRYLSSAGTPPLPEVSPAAATWYARGEEHRHRDEPKQAAACYRRALDDSPDDPTVLLSLAMVCLQLDRDAEIESVTRRVLDLDTGEMVAATAYAALSEALRSQGRFREGNRLGRRLLERGSSSFAQTIAYYEMAVNLAEMEEDLDRALDYARRSVDLAPDELKAYPLAALGWVHYKRRELGKAVDCLTRSSELGPPSATTLTHLGMALLAAGEEDRARGVLARARDLGDRREGLEERMLQCMKESSRLLERVEAGRRTPPRRS